MNPYTLPDGNVLISVSGGRTSGYMLHQIIEANGGLPDRVKVCFANTGREMPETLEFVQTMSQAWDVHIIWLEYARDKNNKITFNKVSHNSASRNGEPFDQLITDKRILPNPTMRFCTTELKVRTIKRFLVGQGWSRWSNTVGIRHDEQYRIKDSTENRYENWYPLNDAATSKATVLKFWASNQFNLRLEDSDLLGNCDGCFLKSEAKQVEILRRFPERFDWWENHESNLEHRGNYGKFNKSRPLGELRSFVERQGDWIFDNEDFLCQQDGGECVA